MSEPRIVNAANAIAETSSCPYCDVGWRRIRGVHVPTQRRGMIPAAPCARIGAANGDVSSERPWLAYVDGAVLRKKSGEARRWKTATSAYRAACRGSQDIPDY